MTLEQIEAEVFSLPKESQVILLSRLLERLRQDSEIDQEISEIWVKEAQKRDRAMNANQVSGTTAEEVFQRVRASLK